MGRRRGQASGASLGLLGALLLAAGCFAPIASAPGGAAIALVPAGSIPARLILVAALASVALVLLGRRRALLGTGAFAALMVLAEFLAYRSHLVTVPASGSPGDAIAASFTYEWGWALLTCGPALLLFAGFFSGHRRRR